MRIGTYPPLVEVRSYTTSRWELLPPLVEDRHLHNPGRCMAGHPTYRDTWQGMGWQGMGTARAMRHMLPGASPHCVGQARTEWREHQN